MELRNSLEAIDKFEMDEITEEFIEESEAVAHSLSAPNKNLMRDAPAVQIPKRTRSVEAVGYAYHSPRAARIS